jgi:hypothetical protein
VEKAANNLMGASVPPNTPFSSAEMVGLPQTQAWMRLMAVPDHTIHPPCSAELEAVDLEQYLKIACIPKNNKSTWAQLVLCEITHWTYFRGTTYASLISLGFPPGPADLLCAGVARLASHYNTTI